MLASPVMPTLTALAASSQTASGISIAILPRLRRGRERYAKYEADLSEPLPPNIFANQDAIAVRNRYSKSSFHALLLPTAHQSQLTPFEALRDPAFLTLVRQEAQKLKHIVASELCRMFGKFSAQEGARQAVLDGQVGGAEVLPAGRDWEKDVLVGVHASPWMHRLHIHVLSRDLVSRGIEHKRHYNNFATPFLIDLDDFPLTDGQIQERERALQAGLKCWRCGQDFGDQFISLKAHLAEEFEKWKAE